MTQKQFADFAGVTPGYISKIEKGDRIPTLEVIEKICKATEIPFPLFALLAYEGKQLDQETADDLKTVRESLLSVLNGNAKTSASK